ncbi:phospholipase D family protein [Hymenobacter arizonensis]|uniref:PLD-like domain-containing protein n=1 Tax=Hymenobacter arizonensis TaxID=1227077 RepID=A0A1I5YY28_HYMAR|nr:phospholipase D family protein [Hymenobacter arizonensis]SFQ48737.1 hypothetical protein SAMN04515668_2511 [Hymenobacter arizonensis]
MPKFVTGKELEEVVYDILFEAKQKLLLVSPYIKLDDYFRNILDRHAHNPELEMIVVFGKNEGNITRSVSRADLEYFAKFPNVTLIYAPTLHAKYYGNEVKGVVTSINLYDYSFRNNIEFGVYSENAPLMEKLLEAMNKKSLEDESFAQAMTVANAHDVVFAKRPVFKMKTGLLSKLVGGKDYLEPTVVVDVMDELLHNRPYAKSLLANLPKEVEFSQTHAQVRPTRQEVEATRPTLNPSLFRKEEPYTSSTASRQNDRFSAPSSSNQGYCIRTGTEIPFNPDRPFSYEAYRKWAEFGNDDYPERYCHRTGRASHGDTSKRNPILNRY